MKHLKTVVIATTLFLSRPGFSQVTINAKMQGLKEGTWIYYGVDMIIRNKARTDSLQAKKDGFSLTIPAVTKENPGIYFFQIGNDGFGRGNTISVYLSQGTFNISSPGPGFKNAVYSGSHFADEQNELNKIVNPIMDSIEKLPSDQYAKGLTAYIYPQLNWAEQHPDDPFSAALISRWFLANKIIPTIPDDSIYAAYALLNPAAKADNVGKMLGAMIQINMKAAVGKDAYMFNLPDKEDKNISLADFKGKYVLVDFWSSGCGPCIASFPYMKKMYQRFKGDNFEIIGISIDLKKAAWLKALNKYDLPWVNVVDTTAKSFFQFGAGGTPSSFLIDPNGKILARTMGTEDSDDNPIVKELAKVLKK